jgi:hypothetical protein
MSIPVFPKVFLLLQDIRAGNRKKCYQTKPTFTRPKQIDSQRYLQNVNNFVLVVFDQLIPVILSADKTMKRQRMILFPRASSKTFNQIFISVYMYFDYWSLAYLCFFLQVPSPFFFLLKYYCDLIPHKW